jgi:hypothetical protein
MVAMGGFRSCASRDGAGLEIWGQTTRDVEGIHESIQVGVFRIAHRVGPLHPRDGRSGRAASGVYLPLQTPFDDAESRRILAAIKETGVQALIVSDLQANVSHCDLICGQETVAWDISA